MDYRYQETLSWIIPGFYFLFYLSVEVVWVFPESDISTSIISLFNAEISDGIVALMVFAIPIFSFIVGWILNGFAGYLFRYIMKTPTTAACNDVFGKDNDGNEILGYLPKNDKEAERIFDQARRKIKLEDVDRFYYRYVASRNMFFAQTVLCILSFFFVAFSSYYSVKTTIAWLIVACILLDLFRLITARDLNTHARYVYIEYKMIATSEQRIR